MNNQESLDNQKRLQSQGYYGLVGGVNVSASDLLQKVTELLSCVNLTSRNLGSLTPTPWQTKFNSAAVVAGKPFLGGCIFRDSGGTVHKIAAINNSGGSASQLYEVSSSGGTLKKDSLTAGKHFDFISLLNYLLAINETDGLITSSDLSAWGTTHAVGAPKGKYIEMFGNEPYISGDPSQPGRVYKGLLHNPAVAAIAYLVGDQTSTTMTTVTVDDTKYLQAGMVIDIYTKYTTTRRTNGHGITISAITSDTTFTIPSTNLTLQDSDEIYLTNTRTDNAGTTTVNLMQILWSPTQNNFDLPPTGEKIVGMKGNSNRLVIFAENSMWRWDESQLVNVSYTIGCSSDASIVSIGNLLFWMYKGVVYGYDGTEPQACSAKIQPILDSMITYDQCITIGDETIPLIAMYLGNVTLDGTPETDVWAIYYYTQDKWEFVKNIPASMAFMDNSGNGSATMYIGDKSGFLWSLLEGVSSSISFAAKTKFDCQGKPEVVKDYRYITTICKNPAGELYYSIDFSDDYIALGEITEVVQTFELPQGSLGNFISIFWTGAGKEEQPDLQGYVVFFDPKGVAV